MSAQPKHKTKAARWTETEARLLDTIVRSIEDLRTYALDRANGQLAAFETTERVRQALRSARRFGERKAPR